MEKKLGPPGLDSRGGQKGHFLGSNSMNFMYTSQPQLYLNPSSSLGTFCDLNFLPEQPAGGMSIVCPNVEWIMTLFILLFPLQIQVLPCGGPTEIKAS